MTPSDDYLDGYTKGVEHATARMSAYARRYRWLKANMREVPWNDRAYSSDHAPDYRLKFCMPDMISTTAINSPVSLDDAIDAKLA